MTSAADAASTLEKVQGDLRNAEKELDAITPPADVKAPHEQLTSAVGEFADELGPVITKLKAGNLAALNTVLTLKAVSDMTDGRERDHQGGLQHHELSPAPARGRLRGRAARASSRSGATSARP